MSHKTLLRTVFIILLTALSNQRAFAQKSIDFRFDTIRHISGNVCFNKVKVIDNRAGNSSLGYIRKSGFARDKPHSLVLQGDFSKELEDYILRLVNGAHQQDNELLLVVYDMYAEDEPIPGNNIVTLYLRVDLLIGKDDNYKFVKVVDSFYEAGTDQDPSMLVRRTIGNTIKDLITEVGNYDLTTLNAAENHSLQKVKNRIAEEKKKWPIYNQGQKSGLYTSYEQFLKNEPLEIPVIVETIIITESQRKSIFSRKNEKGKRGEDLIPADYYAVYTDEKWYFSHKGELLKMKFEDGDFYTELKREGLYNKAPMAGPTAISSMDTLFPLDKKATYKARVDVMRKGKLMPVKRIQ